MKKGFTLIELLAVIVVLSIIALIATPLVINVIDESKKGALENAAYGIIESTVLEFTGSLLDEGTMEGTIFTYVDGTEIPEVEGRALKYSGTKPNDGMIGIDKDGNTALAIHDGTYCAEKDYTDDKVTVSEKSADECLIPNVIQSDVEEFNKVKGVNKPKLATGMTPVKWNGTDWVETTVDDSEWYDYKEKKWANVKTADGSFWVWIPRYVYKITSYWHNSNRYGPGNIEVKFSIGTDDTKAGSVSINTDTTANASNNTWTNHTAFTFGDEELTGIWVAKFEPSVADQTDACYQNEAATNCNKSTLIPKIIPNAKSWRFISLTNAFNVSRAIENNSIYGWDTSGDNIDTHMMKNTEWGAVTYLATSIYGKNKERIWINAYLGFTTGCAGNVESPSDWVTECNTYETENGVKTSTTGTIYGVYDMRGGAYEVTAAYVNNGDSNLLTYGDGIVNADAKYKDVYEVGATDGMVDNYALTVNKKGDAVYEISANGATIGGAWSRENMIMPSRSNPWFKRGGERLSGYDEGVFGISNINGEYEYSHIFTYRPVILVKEGL